MVSAIVPFSIYNGSCVIREHVSIVANAHDDEGKKKRESLSSPVFHPSLLLLTYY